MSKAPDSLVGMSLEWTGVHHSEHGDFTDISTHTVTYETADHCYVTAGGRLVGEAHYTYRRLDDRMAIVIYRPEEYRGRPDIVLHAMFDFANGPTARPDRRRRAVRGRRRQPARGADAVAAVTGPFGD